MGKNKHFKFILIIIIVLLILSGIILFYKNRNVINNKNIINNKDIEVSGLKELPKPEITGGSRGELGIDKNINEGTIDEYLNREDSVYRDMRMLEDPANYEAIGGDRFLSGYIDGFEVIPLPYIIPVTGLPNEVGETYTGTTLFYDDNGTYVANYNESMDIIEKIFPKDKVIFLMCGGGGYAGMTKNFLISLGWDENKIYNVGGYWYYKGENSINVKKEVDGIVSYDFEDVPYHEIVFDKLTKSSNYKNPEVKVRELKINTSQIELEEGASFKLNAIVLPNEASNKEIKWTSSDESIATVTDDGLVKTLMAGNATITATSFDESKKISCDVIVNKKIISDLIKVDDISKEAVELAKYDLDKIEKEFHDKTQRKRDSNGEEIPNEYYEFNGQGFVATDLYREEFRKYMKNLEEANAKRIEIFNKAIDDKKSFIVVIEDTDCESTYNVSEATAKILNQNNYSYFLVSTDAGKGNGDKAFHSSKLDLSNYRGGAIAIVKDGKLYASTDPDVDALKSEEDILNWLSKYININ